MTAHEALPWAATLEEASGGPAEGLATGEAIGRYVVTRTLGSGGMGVVLEAQDPELRRAVAIKVVRPEHARGEHRDRLLREAQAMAQLAHPNVVRVFDAGVHGDDVFVAMELVRGETLGQWLRREVRPWRAVVARFVDAGRGLAAAHKIGLVHRDFKPDNVLVDDDGRVCVTDFGLAVSASAPSAAPISDRVTLTGVAVGTPAYMAPEQHRGEDVDARADVFAFCVSLYEGLYGHRPFARPEHAGDLDAWQASIRAGVGAAPPGRKVPPRVRRVLVRGLAAEPADRWPSIDAVVAALVRELGRTRRRALAVGGAAIVAGGLAAALSLRSAEPAACPDASTAVDAVWSPARRASLAARFHAEPGWTPIAGHLDAYAASIATRLDAVCTDLRAGKLSARGAALQRSCYDDALHALDARVASIERAADFTGAPTAVTLLPTMLACGDAALLERMEPDDPLMAARAAALRDRLDDPPATAARLARVVALARQLDHPSTLAEALIALGMAQEQDGARTGAEASFHEALALAESRDLWPLAIRAHLAASDLLVELRPADSLREAEAALASARAHDDVPDQADAARDRADRLERLGRTAEALAASEQALAIASRVGEIERGKAELDRSDLLLELDRGDEAVAHARDGAEILERALGPDDPALAAAWTTLGHILYERGDRAGARPLAQRAIALLIRTHGDAVTLARARQVLALVLDDDGDRAGGTSQLEQALAGIEGKHQPVEAEVLRNLAVLAHEGGDQAREVALDQQAIATTEQIFGPDAPQVLDLLVNLASELKDPKDSLAMAQRARAIMDRTGIDDARATLDEVEGTAVFELGRQADAIPFFERCQGRAHRDHHPDVEFHCTYKLSHALWEGRHDGAGAEAANADSDAVLEAAGSPPDSKYRALLAQWRAKLRRARGR